jgi:hypothetical protein
MCVVDTNLLKFSKVVKEGAKVARMVGFHFNIVCLFVFSQIHLHLHCLIFSFFIRNSLPVLQLLLMRQGL